MSKGLLTMKCFVQRIRKAQSGLHHTVVVVTFDFLTLLIFAGDWLEGLGSIIFCYKE
jgi:hypothetical protein